VKYGIYYSNSDLKTPHLVFIGRWNPFHKGHIQIMLETQERKKLPLMILVRNTNYDEIPITIKAKIIKKWMTTSNISGAIMIVPDIEGVYYGRDVGYNVEKIMSEIKNEHISATTIRKNIKEGNFCWEDLVDKSSINILKKIK
jgi:nicotinamide mononucleotide adenylyltransferase